jgi:hypothetical protein
MLSTKESLIFPPFFWNVYYVLIICLCIYLIALAWYFLL